MEETHTHKETGNKLQFVNWVGSNEMEMKDINNMILIYTEAEVEPIYTRKWFVEIHTRNRHTQKYSLIDIVEPGYNTKEEAQTICDEMKEEQKKDNNQLMDKYTERMKSFLMDETTEDREPILIQYHYQHTIKEYYHSQFGGFKSIDEKEAEVRV